MLSPAFGGHQGDSHTAGQQLRGAATAGNRPERDPRRGSGVLVFWYHRRAWPLPGGRGNRMTTNPNYHSDSELIKRLQIVLRDASDPFHDRLRAEGNQREVRNLTAELAERIYAEPDKWGLSTIPEGLRDDAASDALLALLVEVPEFRARQPVAEWYIAKVEECYQRLWAISQRQAAEPRTPESPVAPVESAATPDAEALEFFGSADGIWQGFEKQFPRDAFALRLRYLLKSSPEEMAVMLDAANTRAITMRLNRAKDRFRTFCEQSGLGRRETADVMVRFGEEPEG